LIVLRIPSIVCYPQVPIRRFDQSFSFFRNHTCQPCFSTSNLCSFDSNYSFLHNSFPFYALEQGAFFHFTKKTAGTPPFRHDRRSFLQGIFSFCSKRPPVYPFFCITGGLFCRASHSRRPKRPPVCLFFALTGGLFDRASHSRRPKRPPVCSFFGMTGGLLGKTVLNSGKIDRRSANFLV